MTGLLEDAIKCVEALPALEQDAIAKQILQVLDDESVWDRHYRSNREFFHALAGEALEEHRRGETRPLEELLGE